MLSPRLLSLDLLKQLKVIYVNLKALFIVCQEAGKHIVPRLQGKIVNVASLNSFVGGDIVASYSASKGAVSQLTNALPNEWAKQNIQVNAIAPGSIATYIGVISTVMYYGLVTNA